MLSLTETLLRPIADTPRTREHQRRMDDVLEADLPSFDFARGLQIPPGEGAAFAPEEIGTWEVDRRREVSRRPEWTWYYGLGRSSAAVIGRMAFCYRQPLSRFHGDTRLLDGVRRGLRAYAEHQLDSGEFAFCPVQYSTTWGTHEMSWRIEPLIYAAVWADEALPAAERAAAGAMIERAARFLRAHPNEEFCNRGCVWSAIMALCGLYLRDEAYLDDAARNWREHLDGIIDANGAVIEHRGPDGNYSFTGVSYIYLYRLFSGDAALDEPLARSLRWFARMRTESGYPFVGMWSRNTHLFSDNIVDIFAMLERYAREEPVFTALVDRYHAHLDRHGLNSSGHGCDMRAWAMMEHDPAVTPPAADPAWLREYTEHLRSACVLYSIIKRGYQTAITHFAFQPNHGMQTWAWDAEPPIIHPAGSLASGTVAWALDTAAFAAGARAHDAQVPDWDRQPGPPLVITSRQKTLWMHTVFTPVSTVLLLAGDTGPRVTTWCVNTDVAPAPQVGDGAVTFGELRGRLWHSGSAPEVDARPDEHGCLLRFARDEFASLFAFSNETFRFLEVKSDGGFTFADASGRYEAALDLADARQRLTVHLAPGGRSW